MIILEIVTILFVVTTIGLMGFRVFINYKLALIRKEPNQSTTFLKKVDYISKIEQRRHINYLLVACLALAICLLILVGTTISLQANLNHTKQHEAQMNDQITLLEQQQEQLVKNVPLKNYPEQGVGLNVYNWKKLFSSDERNSDLQAKIESDISQKVVQYFGLSTVVISLDVPSKTLSINLIGKTDNAASKETIKENVAAFVKEASDVPGLSQIHVQLTTAVGKTKKVVYNADYSREKDTNDFKKINDREQDVEKKGGKG
ncbi:hypothetical protein EGCR1_17360 (plasmid) [Enterococcus gilvus]|jgi:hypothetical protein|uniref:hypothetical protein n=1 Tax=Enterococcus gilvus TaxID=160453 RepID=UPI000DF60ACF|nr:hypothetical protein [Enterococcus gilvus]AXG40470.1 hypothetical protein EGCR1_17360 [Enterococcus gilvus]